MSEADGAAGDGPWVLGIAASQHNGGACVMRGGRIAYAVQEERVTRLKRQGVGGRTPSAAVAYCLDAAGIEPSDLELVILCTQTARDGAEHGIADNPQLADPLRRGRIRFVSHHFGHALSALYWSGWRDADVLVADGLGSPWEDLADEERALCPKDRRAGCSEVLSVYRASGGRLEPVRKMMVESESWLDLSNAATPRFSSLGGMYGAVAHLAFGDAMEAGKVMGLAPYGQPAQPGGRLVRIDVRDFRFDRSLHSEIDACARPGANAGQFARAAATAQAALEEALLEVARSARALSGGDRLCFAGGVALNAIANERLLRESGYGRLTIVPAADDSGTAIGAAVAGSIELGLTTEGRCSSDALGRLYSPSEIAEAWALFPELKRERPSEVAAAAAERIAAGRIGGWFVGGSEFGPRALGQRSIVADPRRPETKPRLDEVVKRRESFRPYAPVTLLSEVSRWFDCGPEPESPYMLRIMPVLEEVRHLVPAIVHVDGSARVQTIGPEAGPYYRLVSEFRALTGVPILLNTSFNGPGEAIVERPEEALAHLAAGTLDFCVVEDSLFTRPG